MPQCEFPFPARPGGRYETGPTVGAACHGSGTWRGTRSRQPPAASSQALGIPRRTCARIQLSELHSEAIRYGELPEVKERLFEAVDDAVDQQHLLDLITDRALVRDTMTTADVAHIPIGC